MNSSLENDDMLNELIEQHLTNYKNAVIEIIKNNTNSLIDEDIIVIVKDPPLASMDVIKQKLLYLVKREGIILNDEKLTTLLSKYRKQIIDDISNLKSLRNDTIIQKINDFNPKRDTDIICVESTVLESIDKKLKQAIKKSIMQSNKDILFKNIDSIYINVENEEIKTNITNDFEKYIKTTYQKQLLDNISIKIMIKDRTLISRINEQGERYLFTKSNSYIFKDEDKSTT